MGTRAHRDHGDNGPDADDDAQHRECAAQLVDTEGMSGTAGILQDHACASDGSRNIL
jgi:hypothetical protein